MKRMLILSQLLFPLFLFAQVKNHYKINPGERVLYAVPDSAKYSNAHFADGTVYMRNDNFAKARMNYNALLEEMQFIDPKGDTLSLDNEETFRLVVIGADTFYFDKVYLKLQKSIGDIRLACHDKFVLSNRQKMGGMGEVTSASVDTYNTVSAGNYFKELVAKEIITLAKERTYFIGDRFNHFKQASRKTVLELFPDKEKEVKAYLKEHQPNFNDLDYLVSLINYFGNSK